MTAKKKPAKQAARSAKPAKAVTKARKAAVAPRSRKAVPAARRVPDVRQPIDKRGGALLPVTPPVEPGV